MERPIDLSMFDCDVDGPERCGVIFEDDNGAYYVVEVPNRATDTHDNFTIVEEDLGILLGVQENLNAGAFDRGPLSPTQEVAVVAFQKMVERALARDAK